MLAKADYRAASTTCREVTGGELLHPEYAAEALDLYNDRIANSGSPFIARVDAVHNETCFFETDSDEKFDVGSLGNIDVEEGILNGSGRTVVYDVCGQVQNETIARDELVYSVCRVDSVGSGSTAGSGIVLDENSSGADILRAKQEGNNYLWSVANGGNGFFTPFLFRVDDLSGECHKNREIYFD